MTSIETNAFEVGDVVQLKSGGPIMTVSDCVGEFVQVIYWFETDFRDGAFARETIEKV